MGTVGIIENPGHISAFFADGVDLSSLTGTYKCHPIQVSENVPAMPTCSLAEQPDPILAGKKFIIGSSSSTAVSLPDRILIRIDAQNAFGSGSHESTQLVISALEKSVRPAFSVLDVGSGSGVLSAVSQHLDAKTVFACDTHIDSAFLTRHHAPGVQVFAGSIDAISSHSVDLVVANISARVIDSLSKHLNRVARPAGWLILSGFIAENPPSLFFPIMEMSSGEWRCWVCKPQDPVINTVDSPTSSLQPFPSEWW